MPRALRPAGQKRHGGALLGRGLANSIGRTKKRIAMYFCNALFVLMLFRFRIILVAYHLPHRLLSFCQPLISQLIYSGASGDTELFEKASNINGFQGGRVANNLYISLFSGDCFSDSRPFSIPQFKCRDLGEKSAFSFAVACVLNMAWVFSLRQSCHAGGTGLLYEPRLSHSLRRRVGT